MSRKRPGSRPTHRPLTVQQEKFCDEMVRAPSAAQAAIRAGYAASSAKQHAYDLLHDKVISPRIRARIAELVTALESAAGVTQRRLENELAAVAFTDMRDVVSFGPEGLRIVESGELAAEAAAALQEVRCEETVQSEKSKVLSGKEAGEDMQVTTTVLHRRLAVKLHPKLQAIEVLARLRKFLKPANPFGGEADGGVVIPVPVLLPGVKST